MYGLYTSIFLLAAVVYTNAAVALFPALEKPAEFADQEGCYLKDLNKVIPYGDYYPKKICLKYTCNKDNITQVFTCGVQHVDKRSTCKIVSGNEDVDYPDCCPWVMCSTVPPKALNSEAETDVPVEATSESEATSETVKAEAPATSEDVKTEALATSEAVETEAPATSEAKSLDFEGPIEILIAQASLNQ